MSLQVGDQAPEFELTRVPGEDPVRLSDLRRDGPVVALFFPLAWSPVCTQELCSMRDAYSSLRELDAEVLAVSVDSPFALQAWAKEQNYEFPLLSDFNKEASRSYDVMIEDLLGLKGVSKRAAFVIDKDGVVRYAEVTPSPKELPDFDAIRSTVQGLG